MSDATKALFNQDFFDLEEIRFSISYDADENNLEKHRISADVLGSAITNMDKLIRQVDIILNGENQHIQLYVEAPAKPGSLVVDFVTQLIDVESAKEILRAIGIITSTSMPALGIFAALRQIGKKEIISVHTEDDSTIAEVKLSDGSSIEMDTDVAKLATAPKIRAYVKEIVSAPLGSMPNAHFKIIGDNESTKLHFTDADIEAVKQLKKNGKPPVIDKITSVLSFSQVNFEDKSGWKINLSENTIVAANLLDDNFFNLVRARQQSFKKDEKFTMVLEKTTTTDDLGKERYSYKILKVLSESIE